MLVAIKDTPTPIALDNLVWVLMTAIKTFGSQHRRVFVVKTLREHSDKLSSHSRTDADLCTQFEARKLCCSSELRIQQSKGLQSLRLVVETRTLFSARKCWKRMCSFVLRRPPSDKLALHPGPVLRISRRQKNLLSMMRCSWLTLHSMLDTSFSRKNRQFGDDCDILGPDIL